MQNTTLFRRMAALLLTVVLAVSAALPGLAQNIPKKNRYR